MTYYLILLLIGIILIIFFLPQTKNKSLLFKLSLSIGLTTLIAIFTIVLFTILWNSSKDPRQEIVLNMENIENNYKKLIFKNKTDQRINLEVDFEYSNEEIKTQKLNILDYYNTKSILVIESNNELSVTLPVKNEQQTKFPNNFKIILKDSALNIIEKYDEELFLKKSISEPNTVKPKTKASSWTLEIKK